MKEDKKQEAWWSTCAVYSVSDIFASYRSKLANISRYDIYIVVDFSSSTDEFPINLLIPLIEQEVYS